MSDDLIDVINLSSVPAIRWLLAIRRRMRFDVGGEIGQPFQRARIQHAPSGFYLADRFLTPIAKPPGEFPAAPTQRDAVSSDQGDMPVLPLRAAPDAPMRV